MSDANELLQLIGSSGGNAPVFRLGTIPAGYAGGSAQVKFDGEATAGARRYPVADHVTTIAAGKTVLVAMHGKGGVIIAAWTRP
jgi:hypothetical protein